MLKVGVKKVAFGGDGYDCDCGCGAVRPSGVSTVSSRCRGELRETGQGTPHAASPGSVILFYHQGSKLSFVLFNDGSLSCKKSLFASVCPLSSP